MADTIPGEETVFYPIYSGTDAIELPEPVYLKVGAKVIITTNAGMHMKEDVGASLQMFRHGCEATFHNGSTGVVTEINIDSDDPNRDYVIVNLSNGSYYMFCREVQNLYYFIIDDEGMIRRQVVGSISQIPLKLGYSMTIHRSQGQTYDAINLDPSCWCTGQLYVALSRLRSIDGLHMTRQISVNDLHLDPLVRDFYNEETVCLEVGEPQSLSLSIKTEEHSPYIIGTGNNRKQNKQGKDVKICGRPPRYPNGSQVIRIPTELKEDLDMALSVICPKGGINDHELNRLKEILKHIYL